MNNPPDPPIHPRDKLALIGVAVGSGAPDQGCADGPQALRNGGLQARLANAGLESIWLEPLSAPRRAQSADALAGIAALTAKLAGATEYLTGLQRRFVSLGGDHSAAIGLWSGVARGAEPGRFGLIWVDAHMDSHTFATSPSGMIHGMPVACLLGHGEAALTGLAGLWPTMAPDHLCLIGTRSWEDGEAALLERLGVRIFKMPEVDSRGFAAVWDEAIAIATDGTTHFGISIDIDAFDRQHLPRGPAVPLPRCRRTQIARRQVIAHYQYHCSHRCTSPVGRAIESDF